MKEENKADAMRDGPADVPRVLVIGTGAIGGFYGGKLSQAGAHVSVVCRSDYETVKRHGIEIRSATGDFIFKPEHVLRHPAEYVGTADYVIVSSKVLPDLNGPELVGAALGPETAVVLIQNGIFIEVPYVEAFPNTEIISGLAFIAVVRTGAGRVHHQDYGRLTIGRYPSGSSPKALRLSDCFTKAGVPCPVVEEVQRARWVKLVWNAPFNPISVLGGAIDTQVILSRPELVILIRKCMEEVLDLAAADGFPLGREIIQENIDATLAMQEPYRTSMLVDFEAGRPMEVEAILGNAVRYGREKGVPVPALQALYALLESVGRDSRKRIKF